MAIVDELIAVLGYEIEGEELVRRFEDSLDRVNKRLTKFVATAGKAAAIATGALTAAFAYLGRTVISTSAQFEVYGATLKTIEGSSEKAKKSLDWIAEFGKKTPYDVAQVTEAFVALKAYGIDPIADDALRTLGDTAAAMGKPLRQAVEAFADAATGEFERLKEFGLKAKTEGDNVTFSWTKNGQEMTKTVKKSSNEIRAFLLETMGDRFSGAMDEQSKTWTGMMSNLGDTWTDFQRRVGQKGFFEYMKGRLKGFIDALIVLDEDGTIDRWAEKISDALITVANIFMVVSERIVANISYLADNWDSLEQPMMMVIVLIGIMIAKAFPLITMLSLLTLALDDLLAYMQGGESIIGDFIKKLTDMTGVSEGVAEAITGLGAAVTAAMSAAFLVAPVTMTKKLGGLLFKGLVALAPLIIKGAVSAFALLSNPIGWAIIIGTAAAGIVYYFWDEIVAAWDWLSDKVGTLAKKFGDWFKDASWGQILATVAFPVIGIFWDEILAALKATGARATAIFSTIKEYILGIDWVQTGIGIMSSIWDGMKSLGGKIQDWFLSIVPSWARRFLEGEEELASPAGRLDVLSPNLEANLAKVTGSKSSGSARSDMRRDNRRYKNVITVNQEITQAADAPRNAASATADAIGSNFTNQRSQIEAEPSTQ